VHQKKPKLVLKTDEHYYCKVRKDILVCQEACFDGGYFQRILSAHEREWIENRDAHTLRHLTEMGVLACVTRLVDRRARGSR
jgi:hypothetical protein